MQATWIRKLMVNGGSTVVVLPGSLLEATGLQRGDAVSVSTITGREIIVRPLGRYIESLPPEERDRGVIKL